MAPSLLASALLLALPLLGYALPTNDQPAESRPAPLQPQGLNITTLTANAKKESVIECWKVADLAVSDTPGIQGALVAPLAAPTKLNYFTIPPKFDGGLHNAPVVQCVSPFPFPAIPSTTSQCLIRSFLTPHFPSSSDTDVNE